MKAFHVPGPILGSRSLNGGLLDVTTLWVIKGETTDKVRHSYGYGTIEQCKAAYHKPTDSNTVVLGIGQTVMSDGSVLYNHICNVWD